MEWKNLGVIAAVMLLLISPIAFAREGESGGGGSGGSGGSGRSGGSDDSASSSNSNDDGTADQGSGDVAVPATASVAANACPASRTIKVKCDGTQPAREWRDARGCKYECATGRDLARAISITEANAGATSATSATGIVPIGAGPVESSTSPDGTVRVSVSADPQEAKVGSTIKVTGIVAFDSPSASAVAVEKKFKVEIRMTGMEGSSGSGNSGPGSANSGRRGGSGIEDSSSSPDDDGTADQGTGDISTSRASGQISFREAESGDSQRGRRDDIVSSTVRAISSIFGKTDDSTTEVRQEDKNAEDESSDDSRSRSSTGAVVSAVDTASNSGSASEDRTDFITLKSGEKKEVSAFFKARTPGMKIAKVEVYELVRECIASTDPAATAAATCKEGFRKVAEAKTKVRVVGVMPPPPPGNNSTNETNSTNVTVASGVISMSSGWNMVSVPVMAKVPMERIQRECGSGEFAWRLTPSGYQKERTLVPGYGYWVKAGKDCRIDASARSYTETLADLFSGWNLVGAPGSEVQIADFKGSCDITAGPWYYQNPSPASAANPYVLSSTLSPGKAYWIKVSSGCSLGTADGSPPVPPA